MLNISSLLGLSRPCVRFGWWCGRRVRFLFGARYCDVVNPKPNQFGFGVAEVKAANFALIGEQSSYGAIICCPIVCSDPATKADGEIAHQAQLTNTETPRQDTNHTTSFDPSKWTLPFPSNCPTAIYVERLIGDWRSQEYLLWSGRHPPPPPHQQAQEMRSRRITSILNGHQKKHTNHPLTRPLRSYKRRSPNWSKCWSTKTGWNWVSAAESIPRLRPQPMLSHLPHR